jgi:hypothetical protein
MEMALNIQRGKRHTPVRAVIYGTEGIGKSTLAAAFPSPVILDTEEGTHHLDVARVSIGSWDELRAAVAEIGSKPSEFRTVVIDSADWAERLLTEQLLRENKWASIESAGYGKGFTMLAEAFGRFLTQCDALIGVGLNVAFVAHSKVQRTSPPDMADGFDRYELKLTKQTAPLLKEWCDLLCFCNYKTAVSEGSDGRKKATGGKRRLMHLERAAAWDAKNRYGLDAELPMTIESLAPIFAEPARRPGWRDRVAQATTVEELGKIGDDAVVAVSNGKLAPEQHLALVGMIEARQAEIETGEVIGA